MSDWKIIPIGELCHAIYDGPHATPKKVESGPIFLGISNLSNGRIDLSNTEYLSESDFVRWTKRVIPKADDIVFSYETRLGEAALIPNGIKCCLGRRMGLMRPDLSKVDPQFLLYAYLSPNFQATIQSRTIYGSTVNRIALTEFPSYPIKIPSLSIQKEISSLLGNLDRKIENLRKQNETLEAIAQTLFKHWFIDFEFPNADGKPYKSSGGAMEPSELGEIPAGWRVGNLRDITKVINGRAYKQTEFKLKGTPIVRIQNLTGKGQTVYSDLALDEDKYISKGDLIYAWSATFGPYIWRGIKSIYHYHIWKLNCFNPSFKYYLYIHLKNVSDQVKGQGTGSIFTHITKELMESQELFIPDDKTMKQWHDLAKSIFEKIMLNHEQIEMLIQTRDALLPKLMSGQLRIREG